ncbi:polysaccharide pyruvyl transferase family protein [Devosia sp. 2618]|uniref:polysaccharide pyruvyl transferase family protein n=1 Tax=Devosia sp. 2618 TaxID=3156454 RepID=UPI003398706E
MKPLAKGTEYTKIKRVFVNCSGQDDNIGDVVLRRALIAEIRDAGELHLYVGPASDDFVEGLVVPETAVLYRDVRKWTSAFLGSEGAVSYIAKPGEITTTPKGCLRFLRTIFFALRARLSGGQAVIAGVGFRNRPPKLLPVRLIFSVFNHVSWRDSKSYQYAGIGNIVPDWAFSKLASVGDKADWPRQSLVVSMRSDRPAPSDGWYDAVSAFAARRSLEVLVVTQVGRDEPRSAEIAARLKVKHIPWNGHHLNHEIALRSIYQKSALVLSDRLHVLIVAMTEGACPCACVEREDIKVQRHFDAINLENIVSEPTSNQADLIQHLEATLLRLPVVEMALKNAELAIDEEARKVSTMIVGSY